MTPPIQKIEPWIFWLFCGGLLIPIWLPAYMVTLDGPAHLAVAGLWGKVGHPEWPGLSDYLLVNLTLAPNLTCYLLLRAFLSVVGFATAEKLLLSLYIGTFALATRYTIGKISAQGVLASYLLILLIYNFGVDYGFYNFILGMPLFIFGIGLWLNRRDKPNFTTALSFLLLSLACYITHISALALLILAIVAIELSFFYHRWRNSQHGFLTYLKSDYRHWARIWLPIKLAFLPSVLLSFYFLLIGLAQFTSAAENFPSREEITTLVRLGKLGAGASLATLDQFTLIFSGAIIILGLVSYGLSLPFRDKSLAYHNPLTFCLILFFALYLFCPDHLISHWMSTRLMVFLLILACLWFARYLGRIRPTGINRLGIYLITMVGLYLVLSLPLRSQQYQRNSDFMTEILSAKSHLTANASLLSLRVRADNKADALLPNIDIILQAQGYLEAIMPMVGLKNIQYNSGITPVHYLPAANPFGRIAYDPGFIRTVPVVDLNAYEKSTKRKIDYILLWGKPKYFAAGAKAWKLQTQIERSHRLVYQSKKGRVRLYRHKDL